MIDLLKKDEREVLALAVNQQAARDREQAAYRAKVAAFLRLFDAIHVYVDASQLDGREALYEARRALTDHGAERAGGES